MSEQDRGAYAPPNDAPLTFDPRHDGDRRGPAPLALIVSALILIALVAGLVVFYRHGVRKPGQPPQVVGAPIGDTKSPPLSSEAPSDATAGLQVYKTEQPPAGEVQPAPSLAPAPEQPQPRPIARPPAPAPVSVTPLRAAEPAPSAPAPVKEVVAKPPQVAAAPAAAKPPVAVKPTPAPAASAAKPAKPPKPTPALAAQAPAPAAAAARGGGVLVQIGAFSSSALAEKGWSDAAHAAPSQMAGKTRKVEAASKDGKTFYRAFVGGFASHADAVSFCSALKAAGKPCFVK
jgi:hypothetical protein